MHSSFHSFPCMAVPPFFLFHSATAVWLHHVFLPFYGYAWCVPLTHATTYLVYVDSSVDPIHTYTHIHGSIKGCKCQPGNSSLVLLIFPLLPVRSSPEPFASAYGLSLLWFPRVPSWCWYPWVVSLELNYFYYSTKSLPWRLNTS